MANTSERSVTIKTSTILKIVAILLALALMWVLRDILTLLLVALFVAALMHPAARWGARHRVPKGVIVISIYLIAFSGFALALRLIVPTLAREITNISQTIGPFLTGLSKYVQDFREFIDIHGLTENLSASLATFSDQIGGAATSLFSTITGLFGGIAGLIIILVMAFYMVVEDKEAAFAFRNFVPERHQAFVTNLLTQVEDKIGGWLRGQLMLSVSIAFLYYIGLLVIGVPGPLPLALFAGFAEFIPYLGPVLAGIPIIIVAFSDAPVKALFAAALMVVIQQVENHVLAPKVMQKAVGLNPLVSIIAVLVGAKLFGIVGVLLAIPFATTASVVLMELYRFNRRP